ncbi:YDG/SRA domain protein [Caballeronia choica]|uniref:YDG/SRA domain protein n=1 Tax=Caballeronia choica TaxID=326476 RepID=A0A158KW20_9BURK|nr:YDG/SRA domain protein [Caballeronia choica]
MGTEFPSYAALYAAGIHNHTQAGISGSSKQGADSIVVSGGYQDDQDFGNEIIYTGHGGRDSAGRHVDDQKLERGNLALVVNEIEGLPLRVIRGADQTNPFAPAEGYRYDGLFRVDSHWCDVGKAGFKVWRYRLLKIGDESPTQEDHTPGAPYEGDNAQTHRLTTSVQRIVRDTKQAKMLKWYYRHTCQVCGIRIAVAGAHYIEAAHIRPLGKPHDGPDTTDNIICLCPNHHIMFDLGAFSISDDYALIGIEGKLSVRDGHKINSEHLAYHRERFLSRFESRG